MTKIPACLLVLGLLISRENCPAQVSGNIGFSQPYGNGRLRPEQSEREKRLPVPNEIPAGSNAMFLDASVLINVPADEFVAVFGLAQSGETPVACLQKMDAVLQQFGEALKPLGIGSNDVFVDFIAQEKIYGYRVQESVAKEELTGFELKKNVSIHYRDKALLDRVVIAAARQQIFDLIKVDYIVRNPAPVQGRLLVEAAAIIQGKAAAYRQLFGINLAASPLVVAHKPGVYYPSESYESYTAFEGERVERSAYQSKYTVQDLRKSRTFYFNPLNANGYDTVINPGNGEPVVQFTLYLKLRYELDRENRPSAGK